MVSEFGDIGLFNEAYAQDPVAPDVGKYLESVGLSESERAEVRALFDTFCVAIQNAETVGLPGDPNTVQETAPVNPRSVN